MSNALGLIVREDVYPRTRAGSDRANRKANRLRSANITDESEFILPVCHASASVKGCACLSPLAREESSELPLRSLSRLPARKTNGAERGVGDPTSHSPGRAALLRSAIGVRRIARNDRELHAGTAITFITIPGQLCSRRDVILRRRSVKRSGVSLARV